MAPRGRTQRGKAQCRALVEAAFELIAAEGFEGLRTRDVAARAGVNIATLHYYFATKEDLIRAVVERLWEEFVGFGAPAEPARPLRSPLENLRQELVDLERHVRERPATFIVLFEIVLRGLHNPAISAMTRDLNKRWESYIESLLIEGVRQGVFRAKLDTSAVAADIVALLNGTLSASISYEEPFPVDRVFARIEPWLIDAPH
jgi:AcrR family transcriptional regulator